MSHLTLQDRITIQSELNQGSSFNTIARLISKSLPLSPARFEIIC